jgi:hypothetical protein
MSSDVPRPPASTDDDSTTGSQLRRLNLDIPRAAAVQVATWALGVAAEATDDPDDLERIDRVAGFVRAVAHHHEAKPPSEEDLLSVVAIVITALEVDCSVPGLGRSVGAIIEELDPILDAVCGRIVAPLGLRPIAVPLRGRCRAPTIVRHRFLIP